MKLEELLNFAYDNHNLRSISITREFINNNEEYRISFNLGLNSNTYTYYDFLISISTLNKTILVASDIKSETIKDSNLVDEWASKFDTLLNNNIECKVEDVINDAFNRCTSQDILREIKIKKLIN